MEVSKYSSVEAASASATIISESASFLTPASVIETPVTVRTKSVPPAPEATQKACAPWACPAVP
uniref:Uncharacterized protein n=1 Tax=uncultured marine virus TaxID=186617 RepID=A0A0F7L6V8_9VIRU|nr:hypothetical protein [uncultured marine virus]